MNSSAQSAKLPTWIFLLTDLVLLAVAGVVAARAATPLAPATIVWIVVLALGGALVGLVPLVLHYERLKNDALDERQRELEALARTVASSADQLSIAAGSLHEIADLAQKNLRHAEQLPHKLQDKIAEFQAQLAQSADTEKEELERELLALRTTESERLETVSQRIAKSAADWTKLEAATQQQLAAAHDALAKLSLGTASAIGKAQAAAEQALAQARTEAARALGESAGNAIHTLDAARNAALAELDTRLADSTRHAANAVVADIETRLAAAGRLLDEKIASLQTALRSAAQPAPASSAVAAAPATPATPSASDQSTATASAPAPTSAAASAMPEPETTSAPKRPRKPRREEPATADTAEPAATSAAATTSSESLPSAESPAPAIDESATEPALDSAPSPALEEPRPIPAAQFTEITPIAPGTAEPFASDVQPPANGHTAAAAAAPEPSSTSEPSTAPSSTPETLETPSSPADNGAPAAVNTPDKPGRKRVARKAEPTDTEPDLGLDLGDTPGRLAVDTERVLTSDGATRLVVTAYIGIGNRLFIRGEGPGLNWEKGVPLQFVSIGKWRWETNDASAPVRFKLYKNDDLECTALGAQSLDPGHQHEVTAAF